MTEAEQLWHLRGELDQTGQWGITRHQDPETKAWGNMVSIAKGGKAWFGNDPDLFIAIMKALDSYNGPQKQHP